LWFSVKPENFVTSLFANVEIRDQAIGLSSHNPGR
jgi:hypothetical protein